MLKKISIIFCALALILTVTGCGTGNPSSNFLRVGDVVKVFLNIDETAELNFAELFEDYDLNVQKVEMVSYNKGVFTVSGNKIKAVDIGTAYAKATIYSKGSGGNITVTVDVYVINPSKMKEIKTAQDLVNINLDLYGTYILKSDIDLSDYVNWSPIGSNGFKGMFINPDGYVIKNLTVNPLALPSYVGLFGTIAGAYIDGLILENVSIDTSTYTGAYQDNLCAGGICGFAISSVIRNCTVNGSVISQDTVGGLVGRFSRGLIIGSSFKGVIESTSSLSVFGGAGGIAGAIYEESYIIGCSVEAAISGSLSAGGIAGHYTGSPADYDKMEEFIENCIFTGELNAPQTGEMCGWIGFELPS